MGGEEAGVALVSSESHISSPCLLCSSEGASGSWNLCASCLGETGKLGNGKFRCDLGQLWAIEVTQREIFQLMGWAWDPAWPVPSCLQLGTRCPERVKGLGCSDGWKIGDPVSRCRFQGPQPQNGRIFHAFQLPPAHSHS